MYILAVKVVPNASKSEILAWENNELKIRLHAVPDKNKANLELIRLLSITFKIPKSQIQIVSGSTSRHKKLMLPDFSPLQQKILVDFQFPQC